MKLLQLPKAKTYGVDLDGVCFKFLDGFARWLDKHYQIKIGPDNLTNYYWTGIPKEISDKIWGDYFHGFCRTGGLKTLDVIEGAPQGLKLLSDMGNEIHFVTSREKYAISDTIEAIEQKLGIISPSVFIAEHGKKSLDVNRLGIDVFIEDAPKTLTDIAINTRAQVYCMDQPYNREIDETFITRVFTWQDFLTREGWLYNV